MKKISRIIFMFLFGLLLVGGTIQANPVQANAATKKTVTTTKKNKVNKKTSTSQKKLTTKVKNWNIKSLKGLNGIVEKDVLDAFKELGFSVVVDKAEATKYGYAGCFSPSRKKIILKKGNTETLLHEMGHFVDFVTSYSSSAKEFNAIYKAEKSKAKKFYNIPSYTTSSAKEYFAESFNVFYSNPAKLKSKCPKTYSYMEEIVKNVTEETVQNTKDRYGW